MPRIPQGEFDANPSTRVGAAQARLAPDAMAEVGKQVANLTGAMAQLQDQSERTEAYQKANEIKTSYLKKKAVYEAALETVNGSGQVDYFDPADTNPDISKRKRIKRPAQEMYKEMVDSYEEEKKGFNDITRGDLAADLTRQYVGDDLIQTQLKTNKLINRKREKETVESVTENMELNLSTFVEKATSPDASEESIGLALSHMNNKMGRDLGVAGSILGAEQVKDIQKLKDRAYSSTATQIISTGVTNSTVKAADNLIARIQDPSQKSLAMTRIENVKKTTAEVKSLTILNQAQGYEQNIATAASLNDQDYGKVVNIFDQTLNIYTDPKYNTIVNDELKKKQAGSLLSTALASRQSVALLDEDLSFLADPSLDVAGEAGAVRNPSGVLEKTDGPKMAKLKEQIRQEMEASGLTKRMKGDNTLAESIVEQTITKMRTRRNDMAENLADMTKAKYPTLQGPELISHVVKAAEVQGLGVVSLVGKKEQSEFKANYMQLMAKEPTQALNLYEQELQKAGPAFEGKSSYRRAMAIDLVGKDPSMAYLIPMADADAAMKFEMTRDAGMFKRVTEETDAKASTFNESFESMKHGIPALGSLMRNHPSMYQGIKLAIMHRTASKIADKQGGGKGDVPSLMRASVEEMKSLYASVEGPNGSSMLAINRTTNFGKVSADVLKKGMEFASTGAFSRDQKIKLLQKYQPQFKVDEHTPDENLDFILRRQIRVEPDGRYPNIHVLKIGDGILADDKGNDINITAEQILELGKTYTAKERDLTQRMRIQNSGNKL